MSRRAFLKQAAFVLGTSVSASLSAAVLKGITTESSARTLELSAELKNVITLLAERIMPKTDTPGALEAGVPDFINTIVVDWYTPDERNDFISGLEDMNQYCSQQFNCSLHEATSAQHDSVLTEFEKRALAIADDENQAIFAMFRELVVVGFFTSKAGATQALKHNHVAGQFVGDYPLSKVGKAWTPYY